MRSTKKFFKGALCTLPIVFMAGCGNQTKQNSEMKDTQINSSVNDFSVSRLGSGYDTKQELFKGPCVTGDWELAGPKTATAMFERSLSREELSEALGFKLGGRARYGMVKGSASASFAKASSESKYSEVTVYQANYRFPNRFLVDAKLSETGKLANTSPAQWESTCGHEFVEQLQLGASIFVSAKIEFTNEKKKSEFNSKVNVKGPAFSVAAEINEVSSEFRDSASITIRALQIGGDVSRISTIFGGAKVENVDKNIEALITCSMANPSACMTVLTNALKYASDVTDPKAFPQQLALDADPKSPNGPAFIGYITKPWSNLALNSGSRVVPTDVLASRKILSQEFESNILVLERLLNLKSLPGRMAEDQGQKLADLVIAVQKNISLLGQVETACYDEITTCSARLAEILPQLNLIPDASLKFKYGPVTKGNFRHKGSVYYSNGKSYCSFASEAHFKLGSATPWGSWISLAEDDGYAEVMNYDGPCRVQIPAGLFLHSGSVYYSGGKGHFCSFNSEAHYLDASGSPWGAWTDYGNESIPFASSMIDDGACNLIITPGFFSAKGSPDVYWSNGKDAYCRVPALQYVTGPVKDYSYDVYSVSNMRNDGVCAGMN